jgi:pimeloyl-ACP methyl ester carboxylesterase
VAHHTLILQGTDDGTIPSHSAESLAKRLPHATLVQIENAGHDLEVDQPARVLAEVRSFL